MSWLRETLRIGISLKRQLWIGALGDQLSMCLNLELFLSGFISSLPQLAWEKRLCCCCCCCTCTHRVWVGFRVPIGSTNDSINNMSFGPKDQHILNLSSIQVNAKHQLNRELINGSSRTIFFLIFIIFLQLYVSKCTILAKSISSKKCNNDAYTSLQTINKIYHFHICYIISLLIYIIHTITRE